MDVELTQQSSNEQSPSKEALQNFYQFIVENILPRMITASNSNQCEKENLSV